MPRPRLDDVDAKNERSKGKKPLANRRKAPPREGTNGKIRWARRMPPVDLPRSLWARLDDYLADCDHRGRPLTRAELVRAAISSYLTKRGW